MKSDKTDMALLMPASAGILSIQKAGHYEIATCAGLVEFDRPGINQVAGHEPVVNNGYQPC